jgi:uncharacterized protein (DUF1501 family)
MLDLLSGPIHTGDGTSRRSFLKIGALGGLGVSLPMVLAQKQALAEAGKSDSDINCILIWTQGGTAHQDTFDPKPDAPESIRGEFGAIATAIPGIQFTDMVPRMAKELKRFALLRGWAPRNNAHGIADQWVMSGRKFNQSLAYPCYGSVISQQMGAKSTMPPFAQLGGDVNRRYGGGTAGFLGLEHNPLMLMGDPNSADFTVRDISPPKGITSQRIDRRMSMLSKIEALQRNADLQPEAFGALDKHYQTALTMITSPETKKVFEIEKEKDDLRDAYGRGLFGQSCLLARRLVQAGVRFVTVTNNGGWDTHSGNFSRLRTLLPPVDQALPQLLIDLEQQGMLDTTLVLWLTDFGRTPTVNAAGGRDHWGGAGFAIMAGAGIPGGTVVGATDSVAGQVVSGRYETANIASTIYKKLGLPLDLTVKAADGRPIPLIDDKQSVIEEF